MFEREITQTIRSISTTVMRQQPYVRLSEILEDVRVPERIKAFFAMEVNWWLYNASLDRSADSRFDYNSPELASLVSYLEQVQFRYAQFDRDEFGSVLDSAVKLMYNYLCRPQTTLKWFIFRGQPVKPLDEVMLRMGAFADYHYFHTVFANWVERKRKQRQGLEGISAAEFERVVRRIDDQILLSCTVQDLLEIMHPVFEVIGQDDQIPVPALIIFFDDKNIQKLVEQLEDWQQARGDTISREEFITVLEQLLDSAEGQPEADFSEVYQQDALDEVVKVHLEKIGKVYLDYKDTRQPEPAAGHGGRQTDEETTAHPRQPFVPQPMPRSSVVQPDPVSPVRPPDAGITGEVIDEPDEDAEEPVDLHTGTPPGDAEPAQTPAAPVEDTSDQDEDQEEPLPQIYAGQVPEPEDADAGGDPDGNVFTSHTHPVKNQPKGAARAGTTDNPDAAVPAPAVQTEKNAAPAPPAVAVQSPARADIRQFIDEKLETKILRKIFRRDKQEFDQMVDRLNASRDWRAAERILNEVFVAKNVEPYSRIAIRLTDCVYARFMKRSI